MYFLSKMKWLLSFSILYLILLSLGCYTQLLTSSDLSGQTSVTSSSESPQFNTTTDNTLTACNCTPFEINNGFCWCLCDRCGSYHRLGYQYCPRGVYHSYWGWDYYTGYPWWINRRLNHPREHGNIDAPQDLPGGSGSGGVPQEDSLPFVGNRNRHHGITSTTTIPLSTSSHSTPVSVPNTPPPATASSNTSTSSQPTPTDPKATATPTAQQPQDSTTKAIPHPTRERRRFR